MCLSNFSTFISLKPLINFSLKNWSAQNQGNADSSFNPTWYRMNIINDCKEIHEFEHTYKHIKACCCSVTQSCLTLCDPMDTRLPLSFTISQSLLKLMSTELVMPSKHLVLCCPLLLLSIFTSIRVFSNESALWIRWPKYWSFSFSISPSNEHPGLISFRMDWLDLLVVQGTLKSLLQQSQFKTINSLALSLLWSNSHIQTWLLKKP